jgi:hypothetical protein
MSESQSPPDGDPALHAALEALAQRGCSHVLEVIARMERGEMPEELASFGPDQRQAALAELKAIMAVYDGACDAA